MTNINVALRRAEISLGKAKHLFESVKRVHGYGDPQQNQPRRPEPDGMDNHAATNTVNNWTEQQQTLRTLAGLEKVTPPVVGEITEQGARQRWLANLPVKPATAITVRASGFFPMVAQEAHARIDRLDQALLIASQAIDRKASVDVPGYPELMSWDQLWRAIEAEKDSLRRAAQP